MVCGSAIQKTPSPVVKKQKLILMLCVLVFFVCCPLLIAPFAIDSFFPKLEVYDDTELINQQFKPDYSVRNCRVSITQEQKLRTSAGRDVIWGRMPEVWHQGDGTYGAYFDQVRYENNIGPAYRVRSWINYESSSPGKKPIHVRNSLIIQFC